MSEITISSRYLNHIEIGQLTAKFSADGTRILRYVIDIRNNLLKVHREISSPEIFLLQHKVDMLVAKWDEQCDALNKKLAIVSGRV